MRRLVQGTVVVAVGIVVACTGNDPGATSGGGASGVPEGGADALASLPVPATCATRKVDDSAGIFVHGAEEIGKDSDACGARSAPCKTLAYALGRGAKLGRSTVYVASGTYPEQLVFAAAADAGASDEATIPPGTWLVEGAWGVLGQDWTPICTPEWRSAVTIAAPDPKASAVIAKAGSVTFRSLTLMSKPLAAPGESLYGVLASGGAQVSLEDAIIIVGPGGDGTNGSPGSPGPAPNATCNAETGQPGAGGKVGDGAPAGTFGATGWQPSGGKAGGDGVAGHAGTVGATGANVPGVQYCGIQENGGGCESTDGITAQGGLGRSGCGGSLGRGGAPGTGGGSSVGVLAADATVSVVRTTMTLGRGGNGGAGGDGNPGGVGTPGAPGPGDAYRPNGDTSCHYNAGPPESCTYPNALYSYGPAGGAGGHGGAGGKGGGGAGGWSVGLVQVGTGTVTATDSQVVAGASGAGGAAGGTDGKSAERYP